MKVLVLHSWGIGDLVMATPMLRTLALNGYQVDLVLTSEIGKTIVKEADFITDVFIVKKLTGFLQFYKRYDYFIVTAGTNPFKAKFLNIFVSAKNVISLFQKKDVHRLVLNLDMVKGICKKVTDKPYVYVCEDSSFLRHYISDNRKNVGFAPGSGNKQKFKRWDIDKYIALFKKFDANILIFIGPDEEDLEKKLHNIKNIKLVREDLEKTIKIISQLDMLIGNDNGLMHIGHAAGIQTFTIFGMTDDKEVGGYNKEKNIDIFIDIACRPCFHTKYKSVKCRDFKCFHQMSVEYVYQKIEKVL